MKWTPCLFIMLFLVFVQHISLAAPAVTNLPENRIILFDDYVLTNNVPPTWVHEGPTPMGLGGTRAFLAGTNHYHRTGWVLRSCRTGCSGYMVNARIIPPKSPATIPAAPYIALNLAANLQNDPGAMIESPVFTNGIGTIYFEAINGLAAFQTTVSVEVATSMTNRSIGTVIGTVNPSSTNGFDYIWRNLDTLSLNAATSNDFTRYSKLLNYRQSVKLRMRRIGDAYGGIGGADNAFTVIDNIRISQPPADVTVSGTAAFNLNGNGIIRCFVSNVDTNAPAAPRTVTGYYRRLNLLPPDNAWTNAPMSLADAGDGNGNNERYEAMLPIQLLGTNLEYYVVCSFGGYWYQSPDYTGLGYTGYPSELRSPFTTAHQTNNPAAMDVYALTVNGGTGGGLYTYGSPITVTATTLVGNTFARWTGATQYIASAISVATTVTMPAQDVILTAVFAASSFMVTFDPAGGTVNPANKSVTFNAVYGDLPDPLKTGYTFSGWRANTNGVIFGVTSNTVVAVAADHTLTADWIANAYTVTFNPQGGTVDPTNKVVTFDAQYGDLPEPTRTGYTFTGWRESTNGIVFGVASNTLVSVASDHTLSASWSANTYTVAFDADGGTVDPTNKVVTFDAVYGVMPDPARIGYTFSGWKENTNGIVFGVTSNTVVAVAADHTLIANWSANTYTVTFNPQGGTVNPANKAVTFDAIYGELPDPAKTGYTFTGWKANTNGVFFKVTSNTVVAVASDHALTANWSANNYTATFDPQGGTVNPTNKIVTYDVAYGELPDPARTGYTFTGWMAATNGARFVVSSNSVVSIASDHALTAVWTANTYTVTFDAQGGAVTPASGAAIFDSVYGGLPVPVLSGHTFGGWWTGPGGTGMRVTDATVVATAAEHTLYAKWTATVYTVTFDPAGGTVSPVTKTVTYGGPYGDLPVPTRTGYAFAGWWTGAVGRGTRVTEDTFVLHASDHTLYAKWTATPYMVSFGGPGSNWIPVYGPVFYGCAYGNLPVPVLAGHTFRGWWTEPEGGGDEVTALSTVSVAADHTLYAKWLADTYALTYSAGTNGSISGASTQAVSYGESGTAVTAVPDAGYRFLCWSDGITDNPRQDEFVTLGNIDVKALFGGAAFACDSEEVPETAGAVTLTVNGGIPQGASSVKVNILPGTAAASDYVVPPAAQLTLTWAAGEIGPKTVTIPIKRDSLAEDAETFYALLGSPSNCVVSEPKICKVTIVDANRDGTLADALDNTLLVWATGGTPAWAPQSAFTYDGVDAAASGTMAPNGVAYVQTSVSGAGTLSFAWSAAGQGVLRLYDGAKVMAAVANDTSWETRTFALTQVAVHTLRWAFTQGSDVSARAYLDQVVWLPGSKTGVAVTADANNPAGGTVTGTGVYYAGAKVPLNARPRPGWIFSGWTPASLFDKPLVAAQTLAVKDSELTVTANFTKVPVVTGLPSPPEGGAVAGSGPLLPGKKVTLQATAAKGWCFLRWSDGLRTATRAVTAAEDATIFAEFKLVSLITQPVITDPGAQRATVGMPFTMALNISSESLPTVTVTGLPSGLGYDAVTMTIAGVPVESVTNRTVTVKAKNVNKISSTQTFSITVDPLPAWATGSFSGNIQGGTASMTVSALGKVSGKFSIKGKIYSFEAPQLEAIVDVSGKTRLVASKDAGLGAWSVWVSIDQRNLPESAGIACPMLGHAEIMVAELDVYGSYHQIAEGQMYRNVWKDPGMAAVATNYTGYYTVTLPGGAEYGSGYLLLTVDKAGGVETAGKLADGTAVSLSGTLILDEAGRAWTVIYTAPAAYKGGEIFGLAEFFKSGDGAKVIVRLLDGEPFLWESLSPTATQAYGAGFSRELGLSGGWYDTVGNLYRYYSNSVLQAIADAGAPVPEIWVGTNRCGSVCWDPDGLALTVVTNRGGVMTGLAAPKAGTLLKIGSSNVYDYAGATNATGLTVGMTRATGVFKGTFKAWFDYAAANTPRTISYEGVLTPEREDPDDGIAGRGFFVWPDSAKYPNPQGKPVPYNFNWSYDFKILLSDSLRLFLSGPDNGRAVSLGAGSVLQVELPGNPSTGYAWEVGSYDPAVLTDVYEHYEPDYHGPGMTGGGGVYTFRFYAAAAGVSPLRLVYVGPPGPGFPADTFEVQATVR